MPPHAAPVAGTDSIREIERYRAPPERDREQNRFEKGVRLRPRGAVRHETVLKPDFASWHVDAIAESLLSRAARATHTAQVRQALRWSQRKSPPRRSWERLSCRCMSIQAAGQFAAASPASEMLLSIRWRAADVNPSPCAIADRSSLSQMAKYITPKPERVCGNAVMSTGQTAVLKPSALPFAGRGAAVLSRERLR